MQYFKDSVTGQQWHYEDDVIITIAAGVSSVTTAGGMPLSAPTTLQPIAAPVPYVPTLADLKAAKNAEINNARLLANSTTFTHLGYVIACDPLSRSDIDAVAIKVARSGAFTAGFPMAWKAVDNRLLPLATVADFDAFYDSLTAQGTANFNHSQDLKAALAAATTPEQVAAIVW